MKARKLLILGLLLPAALPAQAQRLTVEPKTSLAWWQMDPHYEHLWATTCPADPSWQPGEGRDPGHYTDYTTRPTTSASWRIETRVPLFPRYRVRPVCRSAVHGEITVADTATLRGVHGRISVIADSLFTGLAMRDIYARRAILESGRYPEIVFTIDSLVEVRRSRDSTKAIAVGTFELHGATEPMRAPLIATRDPAGMRVRAQFSIPAPALTDDYHMSRWGLGMGVVLKRWKTLHVGVDVVLRPVGS